MLNDFLPVIHKLQIADHPNAITIIPLSYTHYGSPEFNETLWNRTIKQIFENSS